MVKFFCRELFNIIQNIELEERNKLSTVISLSENNKEKLISHIKECQVCKEQMFSIVKSINPLKLFSSINNIGIK
jgi:hypothetical protein